MRAEVWLPGHSCLERQNAYGRASQAIMVHSLSKFRINIAYLSEARLHHFGSRAITIPVSKQRYWLYYCGISDNSERNGVAIVMSEKARSALVGQVNDRMVYSRFKEKKFFFSHPVLQHCAVEHDKFHASICTAKSEEIAKRA